MGIQLGFDILDTNSTFYSRLFAVKIIEAIQKLISFPKMGRIVPEIEKSNIRELIYKSYRIIYRINDEIIEIVSVFHGSRNFDKNKFLNGLK